MPECGKTCRKNKVVATVIHDKNVCVMPQDICKVQ